MSTQLVFPSYIYQSKLRFSPAQIKDLISECYQIKDFDEAGQNWSKKNYPGGFTSYSSMARLFDFSSTFMGIKKQIDTHVKKYIKTLEYDLKNQSCEMVTMWLNIMPPQVTHSGHIHPLSFISGTFYVSTPANCSAIKFEDPRLTQLMAAPPRKTNCSERSKNFINIQPKAGELILFESWMRHEVPPNQSSKDRISISFNYNWL